MDADTTAPAQSPVNTDSAEAKGTVMSAAFGAAMEGDPSKFLEARRAERQHKPLEDVTVKDGKIAPSAPKVEATAPAQARETSKRQQQINESIRQGIELGIKAELDRRGIAPAAKVEAAAPAAPTPTRPRPTVEDVGPDKKYKTWDAYEDAVMDWRDEQRTAATQQTQRATEERTIFESRASIVQKAIDTVADAAKADPTLPSRINPVLLETLPSIAVPRDQKVGPINILIDKLAESPAMVPVMEYLSANDAEMQALLTVPTHLQNLPMPRRAVEHTFWMTRQLGAIEAKVAAAPAPQQKHISDMPSNTTLVGRENAPVADPKKKAVNAGDAGAFLKQRMAERQAQHRTRG